MRYLRSVKAPDGHVWVTVETVGKVGDALVAAEATVMFTHRDILDLLRTVGTDPTPPAKTGL